MIGQFTSDFKRRSRDTSTLMPENVPQIFQQMRTLIGQLSRQQKLSLVGLSAVVLAPLMWLTVYNSGEDRVPLQWGARFDRDALRQAEQTLIDQGLSDFKTVGETIFVKKDNVEAYNAALASGGIWSAQAVDEWQKMFENINIFTPREQLKEMRNAHLRREICRVISAIDSIQDADVIWAESSSLSRWNRTSVTCSVAITTRAKHKLSPALIQSLQTTVASMIPNLESSGVVIVDRRTGQSWSGGEASVAELRLLAKRQALIDGLENKIRNALSFVPAAIVSASVEFGTSQSATISADEPQKTKTPVPPASASPSALHVTVSIPDEYFRQVAIAKAIRDGATTTDNSHAVAPPIVSEIQTQELAKIETICTRLLPSGFGADDLTLTTFTPLDVKPDVTQPASAASVPYIWQISIGVVSLGLLWWLATHRPHSPVGPSDSRINAITADTDNPGDLESVQSNADTLATSSEPNASSYQATSPDGSSDAVFETADSAPILPFDFLRESTSDDVYFLLADENPQTIAVVLSHVTTRMATDVLSSFPESQQLDIVRRIANSAGANCEFLDELAESLQEKSRGSRSASSNQDNPVSKSQVDGWRVSNIEQLADLEPTVLATLIRKIPRGAIAIAISGLTHEKRSQILLHLPHHVSKEIREHLAKQGAVTRAEIERVQQDVLNRIGMSPLPTRSRKRSSREFVA
jgi:hypothetical protein